MLLRLEDENECGFEQEVNGRRDFPLKCDSNKKNESENLTKVYRQPKSCCIIWSFSHSHSELPHWQSCAVTVIGLFKTVLQLRVRLSVGLTGKAVDVLDLFTFFFALI